MPSLNEKAAPERFGHLLHSQESSLPFVSPLHPMSRFKGRRWHIWGPNWLDEQDLEFCWVLLWLESKGWRPDFPSSLSGVHYSPSPGDYLAVDFVWSSKRPRSATLADTFIHARPQAAEDLWPPTLTAVKVSKGQLSLEIFQAEPLQRDVTRGKAHFWKERGLRKPSGNRIGACGSKPR